MTNEDLIAEALNYKDKYLPKKTVNRPKEEPASGMTFEEFIESLSFGDRKQDQNSCA